MQVYFKDVKSKSKNFPIFPRLYSTLISKENFSRHHISGKLDTKADSAYE